MIATTTGLNFETPPLLITDHVPTPFSSSRSSDALGLSTGPSPLKEVNC